MKLRARHAAGIALAVALALAAPAFADDMAARRQALEPYYRMVQPSGAGPFPTLLFVSGCDGFAPRQSPQGYTEAAERWRARGYLVVFVDYIAARGLTTCRNSPVRDLGEIAKDVLAVIADVQTRRLVDPARINAIGWSRGGGGLLAALSQIDPGVKSPLRAAVAYYPICLGLPPWRVGVPALALMAAEDHIAPPAICREAFARLPPGTRLETRIYPDAGHGFVFQGFRGYNAAAASAAEHAAEQFLGR